MKEAFQTMFRHCWPLTEVTPCQDSTDGAHSCKGIERAVLIVLLRTAQKQTVTRDSASLS